MQETVSEHVYTLLIGYRSGGTPGFPQNLRARDWIAGRRRGSSACQRPSNLPALRVARRCSPVGFDRQHILARPVGPPFSATMSTTTMIGARDQEPAPKPVTYEELSPEHKKKYDDIKALLEADLIGSFERTRNHGIRWRGFSPEGALDNVDLSVPSEERTRALRQEMNYMVAHSLHRHSQSLMNELERMAHRVIQEIIKNQYSPSGANLGESHGGSYVAFQASAAVLVCGSKTTKFADLCRPQDRRRSWRRSIPHRATQGDPARLHVHLHP